MTVVRMVAKEVHRNAGYKKLKNIGVLPHVIMGDFDSAPLPELDGAEIIKYPSVLTHFLSPSQSA